MIKKYKLIIYSLFLFIKIFVYFLLFKKKNNLRKLVLQFIILVTKTNRSNFYSKKNKNSFKNISIKQKNEDLAILLPCQLRCWDQSKNLILELSKTHQVFIMTDPEFKEIIQGKEYQNIHFYFTDDKKYNYLRKNLIHNQLHQWFKLTCLIDEIYEYEKANDIYFKNFIKIRTDFLYLNHHIITDIQQESNNNCLFTNSDISFSGKREFFLPLRNFYISASEILIHFNNKLIPISTSQIKSSDPSSYRFHWLKFNKKIIKKINHEIFLKAYDYHKIISKKENDILTLNNHYENQDHTNNYLKEDPIFSSEQIFARYLNINNIVCKSHEKFLGSLYEERHT